MSAAATREERVETVARLRAQGLRGREIASETGLSLSYVFSLLNDPTGTKDRERKRRYEHPCPKCGKTVNSNGLRHPNGMCRECRRETETQRSREWLIAEVHRFVEMYGRPPRAHEWSPANSARLGKRAPAGDWPAAYGAQRQFGSWRRFLNAAGYEPSNQGGNNGGPGSLSAEELARTVALRQRFTKKDTAEILGITEEAVYLRMRKAKVGTMAAPVKPTAVLEREVEKVRARIEVLKAQLAEAEQDLSQLQVAQAALNGKPKAA